MMKWKLDKKYYAIALLTLGVVLISIMFNNLLEQTTKYAGIKDTISDTMLPILAGFVIAYLLNPVMRYFEKYLFMPLAKKVIKKGGENKRKKFARALGVTTTMILFILIIVGAVCMVMPQIYISVMNIIEDVPGYYAEIEQVIKSFLEEDNEVSKYVLSFMDNAYAQIMDFANSVIIPNMDQIVRKITTGIIGGVKIVFNLLLAVIMSVYVLCEKEKLISYAKKIVYSYLSKKNANKLVYAVRYVDVVFGGFINGKIIDSFIIGMLCYIFMVITGFEYSVLISIIIGLTNVIPYFGPFIGAIPSIFILLMAEPKQGFIFAIFILILQQLDGNVIGPLILGDRLKLSSMWILIAILIGGGLFGVPGMILGAPTLACVYALLNNDIRRRLRKKSLPENSEDYLKIEYVDEEKDGIKYFD